jgi:phenylpropionate dioxygenase-like ring-hydroxylating dioxygenase large terminal subunit
MKPLIAPSQYVDPGVLALEVKRIFEREWIFACSLHELSKDQDFRCIDVGNVSVVLQNFGGEIRAFNNVCSHRFARLQTEPCGNRQLKCPYHGWIYNAEGLPYAIPRKPLISEITPQTLCDYRLVRWHVRLLGPLVFIKRENPGETLAEDDFERQWGDFWAPVSQLASAFGEVVEHTEHRVNANWKLVVENTLEGYHVDCVHPDTIRKLGMSGLAGPAPESAQAVQGAPESDAEPGAQKASFFRFAGRNSAVFSPLNADVSARMDRAYKFLAQRPQRIEGYRHFYLYPNFVLASTRGESFSLQRILPIDEKTTVLTSYLFATSGLGELSKMELALKKQFYRSAAEFVQAIFAEDAAICEQVQRSVGFAHGAGVLSDEEQRICAFHEAYAASMNF